MQESDITSPEDANISRRQALRGLIALVGGTVGAGELLPLAHAAMADADAAPRFLDEDQFALLGRVVDLMIPETDTPGAYAAGVHRFIDMMLDEYAAEASRDTLLAGLRAVNGASVTRHQRDFVELEPGDQFDTLVAVDAEAFEDRTGSEPYRTLKSAILFGYYTSEIGASVELRFNPLPGTTPGCVPVDTFDRAPYRSL